MLNSLKAYKEMLKIGKAGIVAAKEGQLFLKTNIIRVIKKEGWFDFFSKPRTIDDLISHYQYNERDLVQKILDALVKYNLLGKINDSTYNSIKQKELQLFIPKFFTESISSVWQKYADALIPRLHGQYINFTGDTNLFSWDDALGTRIYDVFRNAAFEYADILGSPGAFLDVGCGNGYSTSVIWHKFLLKNKFKVPQNFSMTGIDVNEEFLQIAEEENDRRIMRLIDHGNINVDEFKPYFPKFKKGSVLQIPFENNTFDLVYISQVLHWTNCQVGLKELLRVTKPGGIVFGSNAMYPTANEFADLHVFAIQNATGFFRKEQFIQWAKDAGAKAVKLATPLTVFKIYKKDN